MSYSADFRARVLEYSQKHGNKKASEVFGVALRSIGSWKQRLKERGNLNNLPIIRSARKIDYERLIVYVKAHPDAYLRELAAEFGVVIEAIRKALIKLGFTLKKNLPSTENGMKRYERIIPKPYRNTKKPI